MKKRMWIIAFALLFFVLANNFIRRVATYPSELKAVSSTKPWMPALPQREVEIPLNQSSTTKSSLPLKHENVLVLKTIVFDKNRSHEERRQALEQIRLMSDENSVKILTEIAKSPVPNAPISAPPNSWLWQNYDFEKGLRVSAIEYIDELALKGKDVKIAILQIVNTQTDSDLLLLANLALSGIQNRNPGKVTRFIDAAFDEAVGGAK